MRLRMGRWKLPLLAVGMALGGFAVAGSSHAQHSIECDLPEQVDFELLNGYCHALEHPLVGTDNDIHGVRIVAWWFAFPQHYQVTVIGTEGYELQMRLNPDQTPHRYIVGDAAVAEQYAEAIDAVLEQLDNHPLLANNQR